MAFRFRRSIRIAPGLRVNFGKRGVSLSAGVRGASVTVGPSGAYTNVGILGTGLSYRERVGSGSAQQRTVRAEQRLEREYQRVEKERARQEALSTVKLSLDKGTGALEIENSFGAPLSRQDLNLVWNQKRDTILGWLEQQAEEINGDVELLITTHEDTPSPESEPEYRMMPFDEYPPSQPQQPEVVPKPGVKLLPPLGFFARLFKSKRIAHEQKQQQLDKQHGKALSVWEEERARARENDQAALGKYAEMRKDWDNRKRKHEDDEAKRRDEFPTLLRTDAGIMDTTLEDALNALSWPRETVVSYQITDEGRQVWLDVDLPEIEDFPQKVAQVASTGKKLNIKDKSAKQLQLEYSLHIHGITFRLVGTVFATLPTAHTAVISGFSQRLDRSTAKVNEEYLLSVKVERDRYSKIDFGSLDKINPIEAMGAFAIRRKLTSTGIFKAIDPFEPGGS